MYDASLLAQLDFDKTPTKFSPPITAVNTGETWLKVRPLQVGDFDRGFFQLLSQLTGIGNVSRMDYLSMFILSFVNWCMITENSKSTRCTLSMHGNLLIWILIVAGRFHKMKNSGTYYVTVIEDTRTSQLIGSATLVIEYKFIHGCGLVRSRQNSYSTCCTLFMGNIGELTLYLLSFFFWSVRD